MIIENGISFDDVLLVPKYSSIRSRSEVDLSVDLCKSISVKLPIIPANMSDIVNEEVIVKMYHMGAMSLMHRFCDIEEQIELIEALKANHGNDILNYVGVSVGVKFEDRENIETFKKLGIKIVCIDIAHLDSTQGMEMIEFIAKKYSSMLLIAGNVATVGGARKAWQAGADIVKVGIGASGICTTRLEAGAGVPQLTAIMNICEIKARLEFELKKKLFFISDGGHKQTADCVKSLCFADLVMLGGMLAGTDETPGLVVNANGIAYKAFNGSSTHKKDRIEGVKALVKPKGPISAVVKTISEGIQSGCSYQNCNNLSDLKKNPTFIKISNASIGESKVHDVAMVL